MRKFTKGNISSCRTANQNEVAYKKANLTSFHQCHQFLAKNKGKLSQIPVLQNHQRKTKGIKRLEYCTLYQPQLSRCPQSPLPVLPKRMPQRIGAQRCIGPKQAKPKILALGCKAKEAGEAEVKAVIDLLLNPGAVADCHWGID